MNNGDCFILDAGRNIYVYVGTKARRIEKLKAVNAANQIRDQDHAGKAKVIIVGKQNIILLKLFSSSFFWVRNQPQCEK